MQGLRTTRTHRLGIGAFVLALAAATACAPKVARRQTDVMEKAGTVKVSAAELRAAVNDLADRITGLIEEGADRMRAQTRDPGVSRRALVLKVEGLPAIYTAAFRADPLAAVVDVWALSFQAVEYVETGVGREAFGDQQPVARETARQMLAEADATLERIAVDRQAFVRARASVNDWAARHPIERTLASRASIASFAAQLRAEGRDAFVAMGAVSETVENLSERLNIWAAQMPRQARWQAELFTIDALKDPQVDAVLEDVHALGATARRANGILDDPATLVGPATSTLREMLAAERKAALAGVNDQRLLTLEFVTAERVAVLAAVREERLATLAALREERIETLKEVDAIKTRAVESAVAGLRELVDHLFWRLAALLVVLMASAATLAVVGYRLTLGRGGGSVA